MCTKTYANTSRLLRSPFAHAPKGFGANPCHNAFWGGIGKFFSKVMYIYKLCFIKVDERFFEGKLPVLGKVQIGEFLKYMAIRVIFSAKSFCNM